MHGPPARGRSDWETDFPGALPLHRQRSDADGVRDLDVAVDHAVEFFVAQEECLRLCESFAVEVLIVPVRELVEHHRRVEAVDVGVVQVVSLRMGAE